MSVQWRIFRRESFARYKLMKQFARYLPRKVTPTMLESDDNALPFSDVRRIARERLRALTSYISP